MDDLISRQVAMDAIHEIINRFEQILRDIRESKLDDSVCGMCEYDGAYIGQSGDWCNECPGFDKDDCFKLSDKCRERWLKSVDLPSVQPELKKGKWIYYERREPQYDIEGVKTYEVVYRCSECGFLHTVIEDFGSYKFCSNCGAKMRDEENG